MLYNLGQSFITPSPGSLQRFSLLELAKFLHSLRLQQYIIIMSKDR
jgi:hypothetical protein